MVSGDDVATCVAIPMNTWLQCSRSTTGVAAIKDYNYGGTLAWAISERITSISLPLMSPILIVGGLIAESQSKGQIA